MKRSSVMVDVTQVAGTIENNGVPERSGRKGRWFESSHPDQSKTAEILGFQYEGGFFYVRSKLQASSKKVYSGGVWCDNKCDTVRKASKKSGLQHPEEKYFEKF